MTQLILFLTWALALCSIGASAQSSTSTSTCASGGSECPVDYVSTSSSSTSRVTISTVTTVTSYFMTVTSTITVTEGGSTTSSKATTQTTSDDPTTTTTAQTSSTTSASSPLQTIILTARNTNRGDPSLENSHGLGYSSLEATQGSFDDTIYLIDFTATQPATPQLFTINPATGELKALNGAGAGESCYNGVFGRDNGGAYMFFSPPDGTAALELGGALSVCQVSGGMLQCQYGSDAGAFWTCNNRLMLAALDNDLSYSPSCGGSMEYQVDIYVAVQS